jgi:hypothetical protein
VGATNDRGKRSSNLLILLAPPIRIELAALRFTGEVHIASMGLERRADSIPKTCRFNFLSSLRQPLNKVSDFSKPWCAFGSARY